MINVGYQSPLKHFPHPQPMPICTHHNVLTTASNGTERSMPGTPHTWRIRGVSTHRNLFFPLVITDGYSWESFYTLWLFNIAM